MIVKELIERLQKLPDFMDVYVEGRMLDSDGELVDIECGEIIGLGKSNTGDVLIESQRHEMCHVNNIGIKYHHYPDQDH